MLKGAPVSADVDGPGPLVTGVCSVLFWVERVRARAVQIGLILEGRPRGLP